MEEKKREIFLNRLEKTYKEIEELTKRREINFFKKILKVFRNPSFYLPLFFLRFGFKKKKKIRLFWGKEIEINLEKKEIPFLAIKGILPGESEYKLTKFLIKNLKKDDIFYDVGASYGFYTYLAMEFCKEVHAFEPLPNVFENLKMNLGNLKKVYLNNLALSSSKGKGKIYLPEKGLLDKLSGSTIVENLLDKHYYKFSHNLEIETISLDDYIKMHNKPSIIKLDVEGAESLVIDGGKEFFKTNSPIISLEVWTKREGGEISMTAVKKLWELGYESFLITKEGNLKSVKGDLSEIVEKENLYDDNFIFKK